MGSSYTNDIDTLRTWVGRTEERVQVISVEHTNRVAQLFDQEPTFVAGDALPPLWHFTTHLPMAKLSDLDVDGHRKRGAFLPPVALPRRMWAGGRISILGDVHLGEEVVKRSTIERVETKQGRSGALCFVTVIHELTVDEDIRIREEQDLVFLEAREPATPEPTPEPAPVDHAFTRTITPSEVMLFGYSAVTFNNHRIHYDRDFVRDVEGYPSLVFHGPLTATLLADLAVTEVGKPLASFSFRGVAPLFDDQPFTIAGLVEEDEVKLWAATPSGGLAMQATATMQ